MTKARDIKEIIAEQAGRPEERRAMEHLADALEDSLAKDVPFRPEFKAELRRRLMAQARRNMTPWYRRPSIFGSTLAVAAAAGVLAVGLQMWRGGEGRPAPPPPSGQVPAVDVQPGVQKLDQYLTGSVQLPAVALADEPLPAGAPGPESVGDLGGGLKLLKLTGQPDEQQLAEMSARLGVRGTVSRGGDGVWRVREGARQLELTPDGRVEYTDGGVSAGSTAGGQPAGPAAGTGGGQAAGPGGQPAGTSGVGPQAAETARTAARRFLEQAALPVPELQPAVAEGRYEALAHVFTVTFTPRVDGRPVVNARTVVRVTDSGAVAEAQAYVQAGQESLGSFRAVLPADAVQAAAGRGGASFSGADLVWVRTVSGETVYLQPYWRVYGTDSGGARLVRYVPSLVR